jgi:DNA-binding phage protein
MLELDAIRAALKDCNVQAVARSTGIHPNAIYRFLRGKTDPRYATVELLTQYIKKRGVNA